MINFCCAIATLRGAIALALVINYYFPPQINGVKSVGFPSGYLGYRLAFPVWLRDRLRHFEQTAPIVTAN
ncbi:MAG: hypothetical protein U7127_31435 (plasmid) [Phormidium sp.]